MLVTFDQEYLYFGFRVYDRNPQGIQALQTRRGAGLGLDDQVAVELAPFLSYREISTYSVSAAGVQDDAIAEGRARQLAWKGDWQAAAVRTAYGWSAEIAIPFGILNFQEGTTEIGVNFLRYHHRTTEWSRWADITVRALPKEMGRLTGLSFPATLTGQPWTIMPYVLAGKDIPDKRGRVRDSLVTAGTEIRYQPRPNLTGVLSLNPDFSQVESALTNVNFNYNERFRTDPPLFFQEGSAYFGNAPQYFYSNRIPDFDYGAKLFTRTGPYQVGALATKAPFGRSDYVVRAQREFDAAHSVSGMVVATDRPELQNQLYVVRGQGASDRGSIMRSMLRRPRPHSSEATVRSCTGRSDGRRTTGRWAWLETVIPSTTSRSMRCSIATCPTRAGSRRTVTTIAISEMEVRCASCAATFPRSRARSATGEYSGATSRQAGRSSRSSRSALACRTPWGYTGRSPEAPACGRLR